MKNDEYVVPEASSRLDIPKDMYSTDDLARGICKDAQERPKQISELASQTRSAREALFEAMEGISGALELFRPKSNEYVSELRSFRMAAVAELGGALRSFEEVRKFFLSDRHESEIVKLREFVDLCERLNRLKQSGFLDAVADTILKLEE